MDGQPEWLFLHNLDDYWAVWCTIEKLNGEPVITGLRITPFRGDDRIPDWLRPEPEVRALTGRALRQVPMGNDAIKRALNPRVWARNPDTGEVEVRDEHHELSAEVTGAPANARGHGRSDRFYAEIAARYVAALEAGSVRPVQDVAAELAANGWSASVDSVRTFRRTALKRGLLTKPPRAGVAGGQLTLKAQRLLREPADDTPSSPPVA